MIGDLHNGHRHNFFYVEILKVTKKNCPAIDFLHPQEIIDYNAIHAPCNGYWMPITIIKYNPIRLTHVCMHLFQLNYRVCILKYANQGKKLKLKILVVGHNCPICIINDIRSFAKTLHFCLCFSALSLAVSILSSFHWKHHRSNEWKNVRM